MDKDLTLKLKEYLPGKVLSLLMSAGDKAADMGQQLFLVGGIVRDLILNRANFDLDIVVEGDAIKLAQELAADSPVKLVIHPRFGTAKLSLSDFSLDLATARRESYAHPGALPSVQPGNINDDLYRRDFSINAMALCLAPKSFGELIDPYHGKNDIDLRIIRILHPDSFTDDATRILRAIRYEQRLDFNLEPQTSRLLQRDIPLLDTVSSDRIRHELELILREQQPERVLGRAAELGILGKILPALNSIEELGKRYREVRLNYRQSYHALLYLCLLTYNLTDRENEQFLVRLNFPKKQARAMRQTQQLKARIPDLDKPRLKPAEIYTVLHGLTSTAIQANLVASTSITVRQHLELYLTKLRYIKPLLTGVDLLNMGIAAGPQLGKVLDTLHRAKLNGEVKTRKDEEELVHKLLGTR